MPFPTHRPRRMRRTQTLRNLVRETRLSPDAMIYPISNYTIAGTIWYQGEGNTPRAYAYQKMFTGMIGAWRKQFEQDFPFYYVQIAPYATYETPYEAALLMEQQTKSLSYPKTGMV